MKQPLLVLYASETGNAQDVAERIGRGALRRHYAPRVMAMDSCTVASLAAHAFVILVASTTGQGDPPSNMKAFWKQLLRRSLGGSFLAGTSYAAFGLGDSGYPKYNVVAKKLDRRMLDLGARPMMPRGLGDDQHPSGYEAALDPWLALLWDCLRREVPLPPGAADPPADDAELAAELDAPKFRVTYHAPPAAQSQGRDEDPGGSGAAAREEEEEGGGAEAVRMLDEATALASGGLVGEGDSCPTPGGAAAFGPWNPYMARVVANVRLTAQDHSQDVRHIELDLGDSSITYEPGDILHVAPVQSFDMVARFLARCHLEPCALVTVGPADVGAGLEGGTVNGWANGAANGTANGAVPRGRGRGPVTVRALVASCLNVDSASPRRYFFEVLSHFARDERERERLQYFATADGRDDLHRYNQRERRTVLEVLGDFPSATPPLEWLLQAAPRLRPRAFSISSSPRAHPGRAHLTVAVVDWATPYGRARRGLCSHWLSRLDPAAAGGALVPIWASQGALRLPPPSVPLILVGPGTGCAPFRAFLEDRAAAAAGPPPAVGEAPGGDTAAAPPPGPQVAPVLLFFGCRYEAKDFLYRGQWLSYCLPGGALSPAAGGGLHVAFSRDQKAKVYVQHRVLEQGARVWELLQRGGAAVFVAGSAARMPADVAAAFERVAAEVGGLAAGNAARWLRELARAGRYNVEAWS